MTLLELFRERVTDEIRALAVERILNGGNLATKKKLPRQTIKLALLLVRETAPMETLKMEEMACIMGITRQTLSKMDRSKKFVHILNH